MKTILTAFLLLAGCCVVSAGFKLPRHAHRIDNLDEAVAQAKQSGKALAFVYTDEHST